MHTGEPRPREPDIPVEQFLVNPPLFSGPRPDEIKLIAGVIAMEGRSLSVPDSERLRTCTG